MPVAERPSVNNHEVLLFHEGAAIKKWLPVRPLWGYMGDKQRQDLGKADTPSNKGKQQGKQIGKH